MILFFTCMTLLWTTPSDAETLMKRVNWDGIQVARCIDNYMSGTANGDKTQIRSAFLPTAALQILRDGKPVRIPVEEYVGFFKEGVATGRIGRLVSADITGHTAMVKVEIETKSRFFTDYLVLLKVDGEWKIAEKIAFSAKKKGA